jgi:predicted DNA-binding antitoxin AbrB/MazE fold protein
MTYDIDAIYDNGVFRPLEPLIIPDGMRVHLRVDESDAREGSTSSSKTDEMVRRRTELDEFRRVMAQLPVESPDDGFSGADHDQILYGKP